VAITDDLAHGRVIGRELGDDCIALLWNPRWTAADNLENTTTVDLDGPYALTTPRTEHAAA